MRYTLIDAQKPMTEGGWMPRDTGWLRASLRGQVNSPVNISLPNPYRSSIAQRQSGLGLRIDKDGIWRTALSKWRKGETFYATWNAPYARFVNYDQGRLFRERAVQNWPRHVRRAIKEIRGKKTKGG